MNLKKRLLILFLTLIIFPLNTLAYSKYLVPGGENLGINIQAKGVLIVGFYDIGNSRSDLQIGDMIVSINDKSINSISEMLNLIDTNQNNLSLKIGYLRGGNLNYTNLNIIKDSDGVFKTGLYVKDSITGIGTLTFIDPISNKYGALGHSITDSKTNTKFEIKNGKIFKAVVTDISKSTNGFPGEKNAKFYLDTNFGTIENNLETGIYGVYKLEYNHNNILPVADIDEIEVGDAYIKTTLDDNIVNDFTISILSIDKNSPTKNILFKITDIDY
jgi:stage IV sporulation protein B